MDDRELQDPDPETDELAHRVIGAAIEVHRHLGAGFLEKIYEEALCIEFRLRGIPYARQAHVEVHYKDHSVGEARIDLLVGDRLIVELKAVKAIPEIDVMRVVSYLKATRLTLALVINFNTRLMKDGVQRVVRSRD